MVLAVLLFLAGMVIITKFRPRLDEADRPSSETNLGDPFKNPQLIRLRAEVDTLLASISVDSPEPEDLENLEKAISLQREVIRTRGSEIAPRADLDRLEELLTLYDVRMGRFLMAQSERLEEEATDWMEKQQYAEAIAALESARNLQEEVNQQYPRSTDRNPTRLHRLSNQVLLWQTKPVADEADRLKSEAFQLIEAGRFTEARARMQMALAKQQELNEFHRGSRSASMARLREFEEAWKQVQVAEDAALVDNLIQQARSALATEQYTLSIARAEEAEALQRRIMSRFPELDAARPEILSSISQLKDTAASLPAYKEILELRDSVRAMLRDRQTESLKNKLSEWLRAMQAFNNNYPRSEFIGKLNGAEVTYLHQIREDIPGVLETVYSNLVAIPEFGAWQLYRTEVPQSLFFLVTKNNPSVKIDPALPVDSVTWEETKDFLSKMSWILARPTRLPEREMFKKALGSVEIATLRDDAWSSENTNRETQPVGTSKPNSLGIFDLSGNVAEWLAESPTGSQDWAVAIGGSARDNAVRLATIPEESRSVTERNRFVGFRFVVDLSE
jgi:hypothetical protein